MRLWAKLEVTVSDRVVKDRPAVRMIEQPERRSCCGRAPLFLEPTSGNTGISLAIGPRSIM